MEIFVFVVGQADFLLDEVISASPQDASFLAHVSLKFHLSVTNQKVETLNEILSSTCSLPKLKLLVHMPTYNLHFFQLKGM
jgi:hypothetical protein